MEGSSLPRSNASVFGGISKGMEGKSSKVDGGTYTPVDMATLKHSGTRGGLCSIYHEDVCVGCRSRACEEMHFSSQSSHLLPFSLPVTDHSNFSGFSLDFGFWNLHFLVTSAAHPGLILGWEPEPYGKLLLAWLVKPTSRASPSLSPRPRVNYPYRSAFHSALSFIWDLSLSLTRGNSEPHLGQSVLRESGPEESVRGLQWEENRGFQALSRCQGWNSCSTNDHSGATDMSLTQTKPCVLNHTKLKGCCWAMKDAGILGLQRRGFQLGASDEAWSHRAFVWQSFIKV